MRSRVQRYNGMAGTASGEGWPRILIAYHSIIGYSISLAVPKRGATCPQLQRRMQPTAAITPSVSRVGPRKWTPLWSPDASGAFTVFVKGMGELLHFEESGGEGGIRTLGTGVSPHNGLAKHRAALLLRVFNHMTLSYCSQAVEAVCHFHAN